MNEVLYVPMPLTRGTKRADLFPGWNKADPGHLEEISAKIFSDCPGCNVGYRLDGLVCVDCDSAEAVAWWLQNGLATPVQTRGRPERRTFWYRQDPEAEVCTGWWYLPDGTHVGEVKAGTDHQCVVPPSIHPETKRPYEWLGPALTPELAAELPLAPFTLIFEITRGAEKRRFGEAGAAAAEWTGEGPGTALALARLERACSAIRTASDGGNEIAKNRICGIGGLAGSGLLDAAHAHAELEAACRAYGPAALRALRASWRYGLARPWDPDSELDNTEGDASDTDGADGVDGGVSGSSSKGETYIDEEPETAGEPWMLESPCPVKLPVYDVERTTGKITRRYVERDCGTLGCPRCRGAKVDEKQRIYGWAVETYRACHTALVTKAGYDRIKAWAEDEKSRSGASFDYVAPPWQDKIYICATAPFPGSRRLPLHKAVALLNTAFEAIPPHTRLRRSNDWALKTLKALKEKVREEATGQVRLIPRFGLSHGRTLMLLEAWGAVITDWSRKPGPCGSFPLASDPGALARLKHGLSRGLMPPDVEMEVAA